MKGGEIEMVDKITDMSLAEFKKNAGSFYPYRSKILYKNGKPIAKYSAKTKRVRTL